MHVLWSGNHCEPAHPRRLPLAPSNRGVMPRSCLRWHPPPLLQPERARPSHPHTRPRTAQTTC